MALEPHAGYPPLPLRARVSVSCTDPGPWPPARPFPSAGGLPLQEVADGMKVMYERVAGIDVHKDMIKVAIRSPGEKPWTRKTEILEFRTFYGVLQEMARELRRAGCHPRGDGGQRGLHRTGVLRAVRAGLHRGSGDQPGARQGAERPQDRRERLRPAGRIVRMRAAARLLHPVRGAEGGAGPDPVPDQDGAGPHLGDPAACQGAGIGRHQARLGGLRDYRQGRPPR